MQDSLEGRLQNITGRISEAAARAGRSPADVQLVAVTKMVPAERITEAISCGLQVFGENRVQDFLAKCDLVPEQAEWHLIGHLQQNKAKYLVGKIAMVHSLDSLRLAEQLDRLSPGQAQPWQVLVQVNISGEATKYGLPREALPDFLDAIRSLQGLEICGLMTIAPNEDDPEKVRPVFRELRLMQEEIGRAKPWLNLRHLSMGMSNDYEVAIEEGATLVRIGSALFGY